MKKLIRSTVNSINAIMWVRGICTNHSGKMSGMISISTSCKENAFCVKMHQVPGTICEKCYSHNQLSHQPTTARKYAESTLDLTSRLLSFEEIPTISSNNGAARLEAFGELNNTIQVLNYFNICEKNQDINFSLWTKRPDLIAEVINNLGHNKPENLNIIWSTLMINGSPQIGKYDFVDGYFTVYTPEYAKEHHIKINCGGRKCAECLECYDAHDGIFIINELLK
jgi:hypothetical protein